MAEINQGKLPSPPRPNLWQWWRDYTRYHGVWTPGVKWMRNLHLRTNAIICLGFGLLVLALPLQEALRHRREAYSANQQALAGMKQTLELATLGSTHAQFADAFMAPQESRPPMGPIVAAEKASFEALQRAITSTDASRIVKRNLVAVVDARSAFLNRLSDPSEALGQHAPRIEALSRYRLQTQALRNALASTWSPLIDGDPLDRELRISVSEQLTSIQTVLREIQRNGIQLYTPTPSRELVQLYTSRVIEARLLLEQARPHFVLSEGQAGLTNTAVTLAHMDRFLKTATQVANEASGSTSAAEPTIPAAVFSQQARESLSSNLRLIEQGTQLLSHRLNLHHHRFINTLIKEIAVMTLLLAITTYLMLCTYRVLGGGLRSLCTNLELLGQGQLAITSRGLGDDEIGRALTSLGTSAQHFSSLLEAVTKGVSAVSMASKEVANGNAGLSTRTNEMRTAIHDVGDKVRSFSSSMDECGSMVSQASEPVRSMRADAQRSQKAMSGLTDSMRALQAKSREIAQVVGLVETVAYQTRLLSLNASVEAARAGSAGKGFAIVAQEVRALAHRSEEAARKIHTIVNSSINEIEEGTIMTARASEAVDHTVAAITTVDQIMSDIVRLTRTGVDESQAVLGIARNVEESAEGNARLVGQLSGASSALKSQGDSLKRSVRHFVFS
ncbi:MAG: methyl-accepting chemotaxis protein [Pseudomonadota bacterium]